MVASIRDMTTQTRSATQNITSATAEILASTQEQSWRARPEASGGGAADDDDGRRGLQSIRQPGFGARQKQVAASAEAASTTSHAGIQAVQSTNRTMETIREQAEAVAENIVTLSEKTRDDRRDCGDGQRHRRAVESAGVERGDRGGGGGRSWAALLGRGKRIEESRGSIQSGDGTGAHDSGRYSKGGSIRR